MKKKCLIISLLLVLCASFSYLSTSFPQSVNASYSDVYTVNIGTRDEQQLYIPLHTKFPLEAMLKKDGSATTNYEDVNFFRWEVMEGSIITHSAEAEKNRIIAFESIYTGDTTIVVSAVMNDGTSVSSSPITITSKPHRAD